MTDTTKPPANVVQLLEELIPLFREAAFFIGYPRKIYETPLEALTDVSEARLCTPEHAIAAFNGWTGATSDVWKTWDRMEVAHRLELAAEGFEAQFQRAA